MPNDGTTVWMDGLSFVKKISFKVNLFHSFSAQKSTISLWGKLLLWRPGTEANDDDRLFFNVFFFWGPAGAIFTEEQRGSATELVFKYAVARINNDTDLLPNSTLVYDIHYVRREDSFHASKKGGRNSFIFSNGASSRDDSYDTEWTQGFQNDVSFLNVDRIEFYCTPFDRASSALLKFFWVQLDRTICIAARNFHTTRLRRNIFLFVWATHEVCGGWTQIINRRRWLSELSLSWICSWLSTTFDGTASQNVICAVFQHLSIGSYF